MQGIDFYVGPFHFYALADAERLYYFKTRKPEREYEEKSNPILDQLRIEIEEYFRKERRVFDIPLNYQGTAFMKAVYQSLEKIPYGQTETYKTLAEKAGYPKACRAVGQVMHRNEIMILLPCHRVVASNGLGGFGLEIEMKKALLDLEGCFDE